MRNGKRILAMVLLMSLIFTIFTGCSSKAKVEKVISLGVMEGNNYSNDYFGLSLTLPDDWYIATQEEIALITDIGKELIVGDDEEKNQQFDLSMEQTINMVFSFKYPLDYIDGFNPNFMVMAENLNLIAGLTIKNGADYLAIMEDIMGSTGMPYVFNDVYTEKIGGKEFHVLESGLILGYMNVNQKIYATIMDGYALVFSISFETEEDEEEAGNILKTIKFK